MIVSYIRTLVLYLVLIGVIRLMGKRQIGQLEPSEFVVTMLVADLASIPMQDASIPLLSGLIPILTVLALELLLSALSLRSVTLRKVLCGKPVILVENGKPLQKNLRKTRVTLDELAGHLREKDVLDISGVRYAILETDGNLSVFPYPQAQSLPVTIITDGKLLNENLSLSGKNAAWVQKVLKKHKATLENTWLLTVDEDNNVTFYPREEE